MANQEHLAILRQGVGTWNVWRKEHPAVWPDLSGAFLYGTDLREANFYGADLGRANFYGADLGRADLGRADLGRADLGRATLSEATLSEADLREADLREADLRGADLRGADLRGADLRGADFSEAILDDTHFTAIDLSTVTGLDTVEHRGPSEISISTLYLSHGKISEVFLRGCGMPDSLIEYLPSLLGATQPIQFYSCFISYSTKDEAFAKRLHERMRAEHLRVWFAPEDIKGGEKIHEQIERAIQMHDRLLVILSPHSRQSKWVMAELRKARRVELAQNRRKLFPIRLMPVGALDSWECIDPETGDDIAKEVRAYHIPDFSHWKKDHDAFEHAFARLLRDLKATDAPPASAPPPAQTAPISEAMMLSQAEIAQQQAYLATHRRTLASYLQRLGILTTAHAPPEISHGIALARANIARVKAILRASGAQVADHPDDTSD